MDMIWKTYEIETPEEEYRFHPTRRWRFDYCWPSHRIAVEIEGAIWSRGRHTRGGGFIGDMEKYNEAGKLGYRVFRFQPKELKNGSCQTFMKTVFSPPGN